MTALLNESAPSAASHFLSALAYKCLGDLGEGCRQALTALQRTDDSDDPALVAEILYTFGPEVLAGIA